LLFETKHDNQQNSNHVIAILLLAIRNKAQHPGLLGCEARKVMASQLFCFSQPKIPTQVLDF